MLTKLESEKEKESLETGKEQEVRGKKIEVASGK